MNNNIGLKSFWSNTKGASFSFRMKELYWQLRYAWQRAWRGYDFTDVFELGYNFVGRMPILLKEFKEHNAGLFPALDDKNRSSLTKEETDAILDEMIFYFENCDEEYVYKRLFGENSYYNEPFDHTKWRYAWEERNRCWDEAMKLFSKWSGHLWY